MLISHNLSYKIHTIFKHDLNIKYSFFMLSAGVGVFFSLLVFLPINVDTYTYMYTIIIIYVRLLEKFMKCFDHRDLT